MGRIGPTGCCNFTDYFNALLADIPALMFWGALPLVITGCIIAGGVAKGIERAAKCLMPLLILLLLSLVVHKRFYGRYARNIGLPV